MDDFPIDSGFAVTFPCYGIASGTGGLLAPLPHGLGFVLNTDEDLAERYRKKHGLTNRLLPFPDAESLLQHLMALPPAVTHVMVDPHGTHVVTIELVAFRRMLLSFTRRGA